MDETTDGTPAARFDSTHWSLVVQAQHRSSPEGQAAFAELCQRYWYPLYAYLRAAGNDVHRAQDLTQSFFAKLMEKNYLADVDRERGKFRTFLLTSLSNFAANEYDKRMAKKRGGDRVHVSLQLNNQQFQDAERSYQADTDTTASPSRQFEQQWARTLLERVIEQLEHHFQQTGKESWFKNLKQYLVAGEPETVAEVAERLGLSESATRVAISRLRAKYRESLRAEIADTVANVDEVEEEISALFSAFSL